ncbi:UNVERIFIED_CONTAM: hypothetical protein GTU68_052331 [Idotea baltica]|nr:hypothetical protein [Idotea baltica]
MRVGTITEVHPFPEAHNPSYKIYLDFGPLGMKKSSAQVTTLYDSEDIIGRQVIAVVNFPKKQIANFMSECLILGVVGANKSVTLISPDSPVKNGDRVG